MPILMKKKNKKNKTNANNTKQENKIQQLSFDIQLNKPSGLSLDQFKKFLQTLKIKIKSSKIMRNIFIT